MSCNYTSTATTYNPSLAAIKCELLVLKPLSTMSYYNEAVDQCIHVRCNRGLAVSDLKVNKVFQLHLVKQHQSVSQWKILNSVGLLPINRLAIVENEFEPSDVTERPVSDSMIVQSQQLTIYRISFIPSLICSFSNSSGISWFLPNFFSHLWRSCLFHRCTFWVLPLAQRTLLQLDWNPQLLFAMHVQRSACQLQSKVLLFLWKHDCGVFAFLLFLWKYDCGVFAFLTHFCFLLLYFIVKP